MHRRTTASPGLTAAVQTSHSLVQVIASVSSPAVEDFCEKTQSHYRLVSYEEVPAAINQAYLNLLARYDISYQPVPREATSLRVRVLNPGGAGEISLPIPPL